MSRTDQELSSEFFLGGERVAKGTARESFPGEGMLENTHMSVGQHSRSRDEERECREMQESRKRPRKR